MTNIVGVKESSNATFKIKDLGQFKFFLGLEVARTHEGMHICQRKYVMDILVDIRMLNAKQASNPMVKKNEILFEENISIHDASIY